MPMMKVRKPLIVMGALFSAAVAGAVVFAKAIEETWHHNPVANSAILGLLGAGLVYTLYTLILLWRGQRQWREFENNLITWSDSTKLKGVLSFFNGRLESELGSHDAQLREEIIASFESSLDLRSRLAEYMAGLLIGLGLLGTFIGLMSTMGSIGSVLDALNAPGGIKVADMLSGLSQPLAGMSSAFSASLMGLLGSLLMGAIAQFMSDANDNLVQRIRSWSQIRNVKEEAGALRSHTGSDGSEAHRHILAARAAHAEMMSELVTWRERSATRDQALLAAVEQLFVLGGQHYKVQAEVPQLLKSMNEQLSALTATTRSLADGMSRTQDSMSRI
ncbi:MotA/TolQ/ExbB proton channel family protein, partial [Pseudomonas sp. NPDC086278]|uniref:MotA/TolQ/ExbB proton channel family protein n=1 Tax=Pseudomonas sp. NPDC086278 TaxID=3390646 RepID=UPI003D00DAAE